MASSAVSTTDRTNNLQLNVTVIGCGGHEIINWANSSSKESAERLRLLLFASEVIMLPYSRRPRRFEYWFYSQSRDILNEQQLLEIGAGIQVAPNMLRLLDRWGVGGSVRKLGLPLQDVRILRWRNGKELGRTPVNKAYGDQFVMHRADLHNSLLAKAAEYENFRICLDSTVTSVDFDRAIVTMADQKQIHSDVVLAADGIKSQIRAQLLDDRTDVAVPTGDAVYRAMIPRELMISDPDLRQLIEELKAIRWLGPGGHVIAYPVRGHQLYNIFLAHPDRGGLEESWTKPGSKEELLREYADWDPTLIKLLNLVPDKEVLEWKLCSHPPLPTWVSGRCALLGDACHPMLPYVAQGAAQAVEDAAALGVVLSQVKHRGEVPSALKLYEKARKERAEQTQKLGTLNRGSLHLCDGPEQEARDHMFANLSEGVNPDRWGDVATQQFLWNWDAEAAAEGVLNSSGSTADLKMTEPLARVRIMASKL